MIKASVITGALLIALAAMAIGVRRRWLTTIKVTPVNMPISMSVGHISTGDFKIDIDYPYRMQFELDGGYADDTLDCLTGITAFSNCADTPSAIDAKWVLTSEGRIIKQGTTHERRLGSFNPEVGRHYKLDIDVLKDGGRLATANPRLVIYPGPEFGGELGATYLYVELLAYFCAVTGVIMILCGFLVRQARKQEAR